MLFLLIGFLFGLLFVAYLSNRRRDKAIETEARVMVWREKTLMAQEARGDRLIRAA